MRKIIGILLLALLVYFIATAATCCRDHNVRSRLAARRFYCEM
jgi:hypothetical protein